VLQLLGVLPSLVGISKGKPPPRAQRLSETTRFHRSGFALFALSEEKASSASAGRRPSRSGALSMAS